MRFWIVVIDHQTAATARQREVRLVETVTGRRHEVWNTTQ